MKHGKILMAIALVLALAGCLGSNAVGVILEPLPENVAAPCPHPSSLLSRAGTVANDEISLGRIGDALIACGAQKDLVVSTYEAMRANLTIQ